MYVSKDPLPLTVLYYTANYLDTENPVFLKNTKKQLLRAIDGLPLISVSHKPIDFGENICVGDIGRSHLNIYRQILTGSYAVKTPFVALAEDDILYSYEHFHTTVPDGEYFLYDMEKLSLFTWTEPPMFSFRTKRRVINQLIAPTKLLIESLEERFARYESLRSEGRSEESIIKYWGDLGRYEKLLGVTERPVEEFYSSVPSIVFTHPKAYGYEYNHGKRKRLGDIRIIEVPVWGRAEDVLRQYYEEC